MRIDYFVHNESYCHTRCSILTHMLLNYYIILIIDASVGARVLPLVMEIALFFHVILHNNTQVYNRGS